MGIRKKLRNFADTTSMHGVPKVINAHSTMARCFWSVVCIAAGAMFCWQMSEVLHRYFAYPKKVTLEVAPTPVPFPAISICNMRNLDVHILNTLNKLLLEDHNPIEHLNADHPFIRAYMKTLAKYAPLWYKYQGTYPLIFQEIFSRTTFSSNIPEKILKLAAVQLEEFIVNCYFGGHRCNTSSDFATFFDPYYFNCFTYNAPSNANKEAALSEGIENGWTSIVHSGSGMLDKNEEIRVLPGLHESRSPVSASGGVRVVIHPPGTEPFPFTEGYDVPPGFSASFGIRPRKNIRMGPPYGICTDKNPFGNSTDSYTVYRVMACQKMCLQQAIIDHCNCYDISLPKLPNMTQKSCRNNEDFPDHCMLNATKECLDTLMQMDNRIKCARYVKDNLTKNVSMASECNCYPPCEDVMYEVSYSLSKWPAAGYEGDAAYFDVIYIEEYKNRFIGMQKFNVVDAYFTEATREKNMRDFARINVYVSDSNVLTMAETPDYTRTQLLSDIGGQLALWLGISLITLAEVAELLISLVRYCLQARSGRKKNEDKGTNA